MDIVGLAIFLIILIAICAVVMWFVRSSGLTIPQPLMIVIYAVIAIIAIVFLAHFAGVNRVW